MKKITGFLILLIIMVSCGPKNEYTLKGSVLDRDLDGKTIYIYRYTEDNILEMDSAVIKNNKFQIKGVREEAAVFYAFIDADGVYDSLALGIPVLLKPGGVTTFKITGNDAIIGGNKENEDYQKLIDRQKIIGEKASDMRTRYQSSNSEEEKEELDSEFSELIEESQNMIIEFMYKHINNPFGQSLFLEQYRLLTMEQVKELLSLADESFSSHPEVIEILAQIEPKGKFAVGTKYIDFTLTDIKGNSVSLSDYVGKGKYVLVDFWASWCTPCIQEMPFLAAFYKEMENENFEIVGVSLDDNKENWIKAIQQNNMSWPQMSDLKKASQAAELYNVEYIPYTVLIDPEGNIIADNLRGQDLEEAILHAMNIPHSH